MFVEVTEHLFLFITSQSGNKYPEGITLIPWKQSKCLVWGVTVPDNRIYHQQSQKLEKLKTNQQHPGERQRTGNRITTATGEIKESSYTFQQISVAIQRGSMLSFRKSFKTDKEPGFKASLHKEITIMIKL